MEKYLSLPGWVLDVVDMVGRTEARSSQEEPVTSSGLGVVRQELGPPVELPQEGCGLVVAVCPPDVPGLVVAHHLPSGVFHVEDLRH